MHAQETLLMVRPKARLRPPVDPTRRAVFEIVTSEVFGYAVLACIIINAVALCAPYFGMPEHFANAQQYINDAFAAVFTLEAASKVYALGWRVYWSDSWSRFDLLVVVASDVGIILAETSSIDIGGLATVARVLRAARVVRIAHKLRTLRQMLAALVTAVVPMLNIGALLALLMFIYAIAGTLLCCFCWLPECRYAAVQHHDHWRA